jgi:hypothetical protein
VLRVWDFHGVVGDAVHFDRNGFPGIRMVPAEILDEEIGEGEYLEVGAGGLRVELGGHG